MRQMASNRVPRPARRRRGSADENGETMIGVVVASRLAVIREGMKRILEPHEDIAIVGEVSRAEEVSSVGSWAQAQVMIVVHSSAVLWEEHLQQARDACPSLQLIVVARSPTLPQVQAAFRLGARGLLHSGCAVGHLPEAIRAVSAGRVYMNKETASLIATDVQDLNKDHTHHSLTQRELEIFKKLASGAKVSEIAGELEISVKTVSTHKARIMEKMGLGSTSELIHYAIIHHLRDSAATACSSSSVDGQPVRSTFRRWGSDR